MPKNIAKLVQEMKGEGAYEVLAKSKLLEREGKNIVHVEIGQPDFATPQKIVEAAIQSLRNGETGYAPTLGMPELRTAIAEYDSKNRNVKVDTEQVVVTPGAKMALVLAMFAVLEKGDEMIFPDPAFPAYENICRYLGAVPVSLPLLEEKDFSFDRKVFESLITPKTKLIVLSSPSNPTGGVIPEDDLKFVAELAQKNDIFVLSDEIYNELSFEGQTPSIYNFEGMKDRTFVVNGFSKTFAMTGWRLGYLIAPSKFLPAIENLAVNLFSCTTTFVQRAGIVALKEVTDTVNMREEYKKRRDYLVEALNNIPGVTCKKPGGAFYVFPNISSFGKTSFEIGELLLKNGVAALAGTYFGKYGEGYLRMSYATSMEQLQEAIKRMTKAFETLK